MSTFVSNNDVIVSPQQFSLPPDSRTFLYGTGFFETLRWQEGTIPLWPLHLQRIKHALSLLNASLHASLHLPQIPAYINRLIKHHQPSTAFRCRVMFYELAEAGKLHLLIQVEPLQVTLHNLQPHRIMVCATHFPVTNFSAGIKPNAYSKYLHAWQLARQANCTDALLLNHQQSVMETSRCNLFVRNKAGEIITPSLASGCVAGVGRAFLLQQDRATKNPEIVERELQLEDVFAAQEIVLTNALHGVQRVKQVGGQEFICQTLYHHLCMLWNSAH